MQNLPIITAAPPAKAAQTPTATDNSATQAAEPFDSVLARQRASTKETSAEAQDSGKSATSSTDGSPAAATAVEKAAESQVPIPAGVSALPSDMLAALLPNPANTHGTIVPKGKTGLREAAQDGISTLPAITPAMPLATPAMPLATPAMPLATPVMPLATPAMPLGTGITMQTRPITADMPGGTMQSVGDQVAPSLFRAQGGNMAASAVGVANTNTTQGNAFSAALETSGKDTANTVRLNIGVAQLSAQAMQPDAATLASMAQIGPAPVAFSQNGSAQAVINTPVTHDAWGEEFNQKITWLATQHEQSAELHLNPPHLGPLDVVLKISGDQATAMFTSQHAAVRDAVEQALPKLREMLADNGIMLGNAMVNDQSPKEQPKGDGSLSGRVGVTPPAVGSTQINGAVAPVRRHNGMVDTFA